MHTVEARREGDAFSRPETMALRERTTDFLLADRGEYQSISARGLDHFDDRFEPARIDDREVVGSNAIIDRLTFPPWHVARHRQHGAIICLDVTARVLAAQRPGDQVHRR